MIRFCRSSLILPVSSTLDLSSALTVVSSSLIDCSSSLLVSSSSVVERNSSLIACSSSLEALSSSVEVSDCSMVACSCSFVRCNSRSSCAIIGSRSSAAWPRGVALMLSSTSSNSTSTKSPLASASCTGRAVMLTKKCLPSRSSCTRRASTLWCWRAVRRTTGSGLQCPLRTPQSRPPERRAGCAGGVHDSWPSLRG